MDFSTQKMAEDAKSMSDLFELVERKTIQLNEKDKELANKDKELQGSRQAYQVKAHA
jgi:hypothetical protein